MNPTRIWTLGAVVAVVAVVGGAVGLGVQPALATASAADDSTKQVQEQNGKTQTQLAELARVAATQPTLEREHERLGSAVTGSLRLNTFSQQLRDVAALDGVKITSLSISVGTAYTAPVSAEATTIPAASSSSSTPTPSATPTVAAAPVVTPGQFGKTDPLITASNLVLIPVTLIVTGDEVSGLAFASDVQHMKRLFAVDTVNFVDATGADTVPATTINGSIYALKG